MVTRRDIVGKVAEAASIDRKTSAKAVRVVVEEITEALAKGDRAYIADLGTFRAHPIPARQVRNPRTGARVEADASVRVSFVPSPAVKTRLGETMLDAS